MGHILLRQHGLDAHLLCIVYDSTPPYHQRRYSLISGNRLSYFMLIFYTVNPIPLLIGTVAVLTNFYRHCSPNDCS